MRLIVGLGNPGKTYERTRHNIGFLVVDALAQKLQLSWKQKKTWKSFVAEGEYMGERILLAKPQTFMNKSGDAVREIVQHTPFTPEALVVVSDDADLPFGNLRLRAGGTSGGQKGLKSIIETFPGQEITRLRIGIGRDSTGFLSLEDWVLAPWSSEEEAELPMVIEKAVQTLLTPDTP